MDVDRLVSYIIAEIGGEHLPIKEHRDLGSHESCLELMLCQRIFRCLLWSLYA